MFRSAPLLTAALLVVTGCAAGPNPSARALPAAGTTDCDYTVAGSPAKAADLPASTGVPDVGTVMITLNMTDGPVTFTGDRSIAPCTLNSFESLARQKFFDDTGCHRLGGSWLFMVQCGDPTGTGRGGPGYRFGDELDPAPTYRAGAVAMANSGADTNGSQFFIVYEDSQLPPTYTVFGHVDEAGLRVIKSMAAAGHDNSFDDGTGRPFNAFRINSVSVG